MARVAAAVRLDVERENPGPACAAQPAAQQADCLGPSLARLRSRAAIAERQVASRRRRPAAWRSWPRRSVAPPQRIRPGERRRISGAPRDPA